MFNAKFRRQFDKKNPIQKLKYERENPISWKKDKCVICKFPMKLEPTNPKTPDDEMTFGDFIIRYEHKFLRNIYTIKQIEESDHMKNLESYYEVALLNNFKRHDFVNLATEESVKEKFAVDEIQGINNTINQTEIRNALLKAHGNVPKFDLKIYAYVYDDLLSFPRSKIDHKTITTNKFFSHFHRLVRGKVHVHHSHITGKILGHAHDF